MEQAVAAEMEEPAEKVESEDKMDEDIAELDWNLKDYEAGQVQLEIEEEDGTWRGATLYRRKSSKEVVIWFGGEEYEGTKGGYTLQDEKICDPDGDHIPHRKWTESKHVKGKANAGGEQLEARDRETHPPTAHPHRGKKRKRTDVFNEQLQRWEHIGKAGLLEPQYFQPEDVPSKEQQVNFDTVLAALESISIPKTLRLNTKLHANDQKYGMCLGATKTYGRGIRASMDCVSRPNLTDVLVRFCKQAQPDFSFTSIQALHVDSNNAGPSLIVGVGNYVGGEVWIQGMGAEDVKQKFVEFDGNVPHATLPFAGTRYTLVFFTHMSWAKAKPADQLQLQNYGFPLPKSEVAMAEYEDRNTRVRQGNELFRKFVKSEECPVSLTLDQIKEAEMVAYAYRTKKLQVKDGAACVRFQPLMNKEWLRLGLPKNTKLETVTRFCGSDLWKQMSNATITRVDLVRMVANIRSR